MLAATSIAATDFFEPTPTPTEKGPVTVGEVAPIHMAAGKSESVKISVTVADGHRVQANPASNDFLVPLELVIEGHGDIAFGAPVYPEADLYLLEGSDEPLLTYVGQFEVVIPVTADKDAKPGNRAVPGELRYQACNSRMCLFPASVPVILQVVVTGPGDETKKK